MDGGVKILDSTIFQAVYGTVRTHRWIDVDTLDEDLNGLFTARAESRSWSPAAREAWVSICGHE